MSGTVSLSVANLPNPKLAFTNRVYVSLTTYNSLSGESSSVSNAKGINISVDKLVFFAVPHAELMGQELAMNTLQRTSGSLMLGQTLSVRVFRGALEVALHSVTVVVNLFVKKTGTKVTLDTEELQKTFRAVFSGQVFCTNQKLAMAHESAKLDLLVESFEHAAIIGSQNSRDIAAESLGQVLLTTSIIFKRAAGQSAVHLIGNTDVAARNDSLFKNDFDFEKLGIGGLDEQFKTMFRKAFASRIFPGLVKQLGINHVRGILLYGPPGCGKTLIARQIGKMLNAREPKIINGPEVLNKFVGGSEEKIREVFKDAEIEQAEAGEASMLHIIIFDEMDAIMKQRGSTGDNTGVSDSVVNQLLSKIDGVDSLNNILIIGMTNRKDMIDEAILRPGRLEVHIEITLPSQEGRLQILNIKTLEMKKNKRITSEVVERLPELAQLTKNYTGAELEGLVRGAASFALARNIDGLSMKAVEGDALTVEWKDFERAIEETVPAFGNSENSEIVAHFVNGICQYGAAFEGLWVTLERLVNQTRTSTRTPLLSVLLEGASATGKTAIAAKIAAASDFPFVRMISPDSMIGYSESRKCSMLLKVFTDSYKSPQSIIFIDDIERLIEYTPVGQRFSNSVLQTLLILMRKVPPAPARLLVIATTAISHLLEDMQLTQAFNVSLHVSQLQDPFEISTVLTKYSESSLSEADMSRISKSISRPIGIKQLLMILEMARSADISDDLSTGNTAQDSAQLTFRFLECIHTVGY